MGEMLGVSRIRGLERTSVEDETRKRTTKPNGQRPRNGKKWT
jgi:hypothetical protein